MSNYLNYVSHILYRGPKNLTSKIKKMKVDRECGRAKWGAKCQVPNGSLMHRIACRSFSGRSQLRRFRPPSRSQTVWQLQKGETETLLRSLRSIRDSLLFLGETLRFAETSCKITFFVRPKFVSSPMARTDYKEYLLRCTIFWGGSFLATLFAKFVPSSRQCMFASVPEIEEEINRKCEELIFRTRDTRSRNFVV